MNELTPDARALIDDSREGVPPVSARTHARMRWLLLASLAPASATASFSMASLVAVGVLSAAAGAGVTAIFVHRPPPVSKPPPAMKNVPAPLAPAPASTAAPPAPLPPPPAPVRRAPKSTPTALVLAPDTGEEAATPEPVTSPAAEFEALAVILEALDRQRWADAQRGLREFRTQFPRPALDIEASVLEVRLRCGLGDEPGAETLAQQLKTAAPRNPSVQRLTSPLCRVP